MSELVLKSLNSDTPTYVTFENRSGRVVNLFWLNLKGKPVRYGIIPPGHCTSLNTYVTHPWIARDKHSNFLLHINGQKVFYPASQRDGWLFTPKDRDHPHIHIPVFPLVRRCTEVVYLVFGRHIVEGVDIPNALKEDILSMSPLENVTNYARIDRMAYTDIRGHAEAVRGVNGDNAQAIRGHAEAVREGNGDNAQAIRGHAVAAREGNGDNAKNDNGDDEDDDGRNEAKLCGCFC